MRLSKPSAKKNRSGPVRLVASSLARCSLRLCECHAFNVKSHPGCDQSAPAAAPMLIPPCSSSLVHQISLEDQLSPCCSDAFSSVEEADWSWDPLAFYGWSTSTCQMDGSLNQLTLQASPSPFKCFHQVMGIIYKTPENGHVESRNL